MPNKPIIDIDINDKQFKDFYSMFQEFQEGIGSLPDEWKKVNDQTKAAAKSFSAASGAIADSMLESSQHAKELIRHLKDGSLAQKQFGIATRHSESGLKSMANEAKKVSDSIFGIGKFLFKTSAWGAGIFAGATFGADKLAGSAVENQRSALGLGMSTGQYRAFNTDFGRYLNPSILGNVANAQNSYQGRVWLGMATGMGQSQLAAMNAGAVSGQLAIRAHDWWNSTPSAQHTDANLQATGFIQSGLTLEDMRRLGATPISQLRAAQSQFGKDSSSLDISGKSTNALYSFTRQLTLAGQKLETVLTNKLTSLAPALGSFMTHLEKDAEILINGIFTEKNLQSIQNGLQTFANYLGSADFQNDVKSFVSGLKDMVKGVEWLVNKINPSSAPTASGAPGDADVFGRHPYNFQTQNWGAAKYKGPYYEYFNPKNPAYAANQKELGSLEAKANLPKGLIQSVIMAESGGNPNAKSPKGALGAMQLMPATAAQYGVKNPLDLGQSIAGGTAYYRDLFKKYRNQLPTDQLRMSIAAYNWGPGNLDKDIAKNGKDWDKHLPKETDAYLRKILTSMAKTTGQKIYLSIENKSGTNVSVSANAAGM